MSSAHATAHFRFYYPDNGQAPDALLARATADAEARFLEPGKFNFYAMLDTYPDDDDDTPDGYIALIVMAQFATPSRWQRLIHPRKSRQTATSSSNEHSIFNV